MWLSGRGHSTNTRTATRTARDSHTAGARSQAPLISPSIDNRSSGARTNHGPIGRSSSPTRVRRSAMSMGPVGPEVVIQLRSRTELVPAQQVIARGQRARGELHAPHVDSHLVGGLASPVLARDDCTGQPLELTIA